MLLQVLVKRLRKIKKLQITLENLHQEENILILHKTVKNFMKTF
jgi:hypothetical protein